MAVRPGPGRRAGSWRVPAGLAMAGLMGLAGCSDTTAPPRESAGPTAADSLINGGGPVLDGSAVDGRITPNDLPTYEEHACALVLDWTYELVAVVNGFTALSREDSATERRVDYLDAFDDALTLVDQLGASVVAGPVPPGDAMGAALLDAVAAAGDELADARQEAVALPEEAYAVRRVRSGTLFVASEKARSLVFGGLDAVATGEGLTRLRAPCGRPQYPDAG